MTGFSIMTLQISALILAYFTKAALGLFRLKNLPEKKADKPILK